MAYAAAAVAVVTAVVGAVSAKQEADYQEEVARNNQKIAEENSNRAILESQIDAADADFDATQELGQILAAAGASGLDLGTGSKALQTQSAQRLAARDRVRIRYAGELEATNFENQARTFRGEASNARRAGRFAIIKGGLGVASSLISGASKSLNRTS